VVAAAGGIIGVGFGLSWSPATQRILNETDSVAGVGAL